MWGIPENVFKLFKKRPKAPSDFSGITPEYAYDVLMEYIVIKNRIQSLPVDIRHFMIDSIVCHGRVSAVKMLQASINTFLGKSTIKVDGVCGKKTINYTRKIIREFSGKKFLDKLVDRRKARCLMRIKVHNNKAFMAEEWLSRAERVRHYGSTMDK